MRAIRRRHALRWIVPVVVTGVAVLIAGGVFHRSTPVAGLPRTTPTALLDQVRSPSSTAFSGTVVSHMSLGLPDLPSVAGLSSDSPFATLMSGSRTLEVWYGGRSEQRVALLGATDETDLFRSGRTIWRWDSADRVADRVRMHRPSTDSHWAAGQRDAAPADGAPLDAASVDAGALTTMTPSGLADVALAAVQPSTRVSVRTGDVVAGRAAYDLILQPRSAATLVGAVHIAVDGQTKVPLGVQIYPRGSSVPAVDVSFSSIRYVAPPASTFAFTPPSGARVHTVSLRRLRNTGDLEPGRFAVSGSNWAGVVDYDTERALRPAKLGLGRALVPVSGPWGHGRMLETSLFSVLVTNSGHVYAGAVEPSVLLSAAALK